jgi:hypothetical protein
LRAQQAAALAGIGRAIYDALVEGALTADGEAQASNRHHEHLSAVVKDLGPVATRLDVDALELDIGALSQRLRSVLDLTKAWVLSGSVDPAPLLDCYAAAEARKGPRARLAGTPNGRARRLEWGGDEHPLASPLHYRWEQVSTLLNDLANAG